MESVEVVKQDKPQLNGIPMESLVRVKQEPVSNISASVPDISKKRNLNELGHDHVLLKKQNKKPKHKKALPPGCHNPVPISVAPILRPEEFSAQPAAVVQGTTEEAVADHALALVVYNKQAAASPFIRRCKQFWKAGDYEEDNVVVDSDHTDVLMDHVRVHPKFLHSNATSHRWALGAFAELLDNSIDEIGNGATYVKIDVLENQKDGTKMLLVEDNGGGMTPQKMRACMSFGYSAKSKIANTIGQYGNGFKTSTMRLGEDAIVFSRCLGTDGKSQTQSIGLLSCTFLKATGKKDIVVPMVDFEKTGEDWNRKIRYSLEDWEMNLKTILRWSSFLSEEDLLQQFDFLKGQGTRIMIYNLWEDDAGIMELDFASDPHDIQIGVVNRDRNTEMAKEYPNSRHFFTYQHSLRSYASILYLRLPLDFRIILRGKDVEHHNIVTDMMLAENITYKPVKDPNEPKNTNMFASGKIGFVKDARSHIDVQGFNVYHKNRLIKPFWRVWNAAGSDGRGVIGVVEANFVEPAHDKQGFERTRALSKLESNLLNKQKNYWTTNCHEIGYAPKLHSKNPTSSNKQNLACNKGKSFRHANQNGKVSTNGVQISPVHVISNKNQQASPIRVKNSALDNVTNQNAQGSSIADLKMTNGMEFRKRLPVDDAGDGGCLKKPPTTRESLFNSKANEIVHQMASHSHTMQNLFSKDRQVNTTGNIENLINVKHENGELRFPGVDGMTMDQLRIITEYERARSQKFQSQLQKKTDELVAERTKAEELDKENAYLIDMIQKEMAIIKEETTRWDALEQDLKERLENAYKTIEELQERLRQVEGREIRSLKIEKD